MPNGLVTVSHRDLYLSEKRLTVPSPAPSLELPILQFSGAS